METNVKGLLQNYSRRSYISKTSGQKVEFNEVLLLNPEATNTLDAVIGFSVSDEVAPKFERWQSFKGKMVSITGKLSSYKGALRLSVTDVKPVV